MELRRSAAFWAAALSLPTAYTAWDVDSQNLYDQVGAQRLWLGLVIPLALGVGVWQGHRDHRSSTWELLATSARPAWERYLHTALAVGIGAAGGSLVVFAAQVSHAALLGASVTRLVFALAAVTAVYMAAAVWLGFAIGRALPRVPVPLVVVLWFVIMFPIGSVTDTTQDGRTPPGTVLLNPSTNVWLGDFDSLTAQVHLAEASWAIGLAVACLVLCVATGRWRLAALVPLGLGVAVALSLLPASLSDAFTVGALG